MTGPESTSSDVHWLPRIALARLGRIGTILLAISGALHGCVSHPDSLHLDWLQIELIDSTTVYAKRARGEQALSIVFEGQSPFAAIKADRKMAQFRCQLFDDSNDAFAEMEFGEIEVFGSGAKPDPFKVLEDIDNDVASNARRRYRAVIYPGLREQSKVNGPFDFDLRQDRFHHIGCELVGVQMFGPFIRSNELIVPRAKVQALVAAAGSGQQ